MNLNPVRGTPLDDEQAMRLAMANARGGLATAPPNPLVGCVILDAAGGFLSSGFHETYGQAHAEINALQGVDAAELQGAQVFVTLEPCAHKGKTGSCAQRLAQYPLGRVVYGLKDPFPLVSGKGAQILKDAGIRCEVYGPQNGSSLDAELEETAESFLWNVRHQSVFVHLKIASSLDGKVALADGSSQWITGPESREKVHELRASTDAILIGRETLQHDNPSLDVRHPKWKKDTRAFVLDTQGRSTQGEWKFANLRVPEKATWIVAEDAKAVEPLRGSILRAPKSGDGLDLKAVLQILFDQGVRSLLVEGGGRISGSFLQQGLVNRLHLFQAPTFLGSEARSWTTGLHVSDLSKKPVLHQVKHQTFGRDSYLTGLLRESGSGAIFRAV